MIGICTTLWYFNTIDYMSPVGRSRFVFYIQNTQGPGRESDHITRRCRLRHQFSPTPWHYGTPFRPNDILCKPLPRTPQHIARLFQSIGGQLGSTTIYHTVNYFPRQVVVANLYYRGIPEELSIELMAAALAGAWGLGEAISKFKPTNGRKRSKSPEEVTERFPIKGGRVSSAPYSPAEMSELHGLLQDVEDRSDEHSTRSLHMRQRTCPDIYLSNCRNWWWTSWNTQRSRLRLLGSWWECGIRRFEVCWSFDRIRVRLFSAAQRKFL